MEVKPRTPGVAVKEECSLSAFAGPFFLWLECRAGGDGHSPEGRSRVLGLAGREGEEAGPRHRRGGRLVLSHVEKYTRFSRARVSAFGELLLAEAKHGPATTAEQLPVLFPPGPRTLGRSPHALPTVWKPHWIWSPYSEVPVPYEPQVGNLHSQRGWGGGLPIVVNQIIYSPPRLTLPGDFSFRLDRSPDSSHDSSHDR